MRNNISSMLTMTPVIWFALFFWNERTACYDSEAHRLTVKFLSHRLLRRDCTIIFLITRSIFSTVCAAQEVSLSHTLFRSKFVKSIGDIRDLHPKSTYFVASADIVRDEGS